MGYELAPSEEKRGSNNIVKESCVRNEKNQSLLRPPRRVVAIQFACVTLKVEKRGFAMERLDIGSFNSWTRLCLCMYALFP